MLDCLESLDDVLITGLLLTIALVAFLLVTLIAVKQAGRALETFEDVRDRAGKARNRATEGT